MKIFHMAMGTNAISASMKARPTSSSLWLWFYLMFATVWAGISVTSNGPTNHFTTILLLPIFFAASLNFFRY